MSFHPQKCQLLRIDFIGYLNKLKEKLTTEEAIHFKNSTSNIFYKICVFFSRANLSQERSIIFFYMIDLVTLTYL